MTNTQNQALTDADIRAIFLANGFTIKDGLTDLKPYVYEAARAVIAADRALLAQAAPQVQPQAVENTGHFGPHWIEGPPPAEVELAWLRLQYESGDGEGGFDWDVKVILGTLVTTEHEPEWFEAGDWNGESYGDSIHTWPAFITHWMPYAIPDAGVPGTRPATQAQVQPTAPAEPKTVDALAQEIRRVDGKHSLGAGALAEALMPFIAAQQAPQSAASVPEWWKLVPVEITEEMEQAMADSLGMCVKASAVWADVLAASPQPQKLTDSMGMPVSCGKPLCSPSEHHPLCARHGIDDTAPQPQKEQP